MAVIRRGVTSGDIEKRIITGAIIDDNFCGFILKMAKKQYFKMEFARQVFIWCADYFKTYKKAPGKEIQNIFAVEQAKLKEADAELLRIFLSELSDSYEQESRPNYEHLKDQARDYLKERALYLLVEKVQGELAKGKIEQAEEDVRNFNKVTKDISSWFNPLELTNVNQVFSDDEANRLFKFPNALGEMAGYFERDWLVAFMAPMKRGKSWWAQETTIHVLENKLKVAYFSLEMNRTAVSKRIYKRLTSLASSSGNHKYPVFDCQKNQDGTCKKAERACQVSIKAPGALTPEFKYYKDYKPCQACRIPGKDNPERKESDYVVATWWGMQKQTKEFDPKSVAKKVRDFKMLYGNNLRVMAYPAFSASFEDAERDLDELEAQEGFVPDFIVYDYFDISAPSSGAHGFSERGVADHIWKSGKALAARRHCCVVTVLQSNRKSISKKSLEQEDTAEDIRKLAHVDLLFGLNQTPEEKDQGVSRISVIGHRHEEFSFAGEVMVLQSLALGQPFLDDEWIK